MEKVDYVVFMTEAGGPEGPLKPRGSRCPGAAQGPGG